MSVYSYSTPAIVAAHNGPGLLPYIDGGGSVALLLVYDDSAGLPANADAAAVGVLLGTITLADPSAVVDAGTGVMTFDAAGSSREESANAAGSIGYVRLVRSDAAAVLDIPALAGTTAESGWAVFNTLIVTAGAPIELTSLIIG